MIVIQPKLDAMNIVSKIGDLETTPVNSSQRNFKKGSWIIYGTTCGVNRTNIF
jgi:hypothetical protein